MRFPGPLIAGTLLRRHQRFLVDVRLDDGDIVTAHTPNTGSMLGCCLPGSRVWLREAGKPTRKYPLVWELVKADSGVLVGINTSLANALVREAIEDGVIGELQGYGVIRREVHYGEKGSRIDLLLENGVDRCYVEVKNVTLVEEGAALFPDAVSRRGTKHLRELAAMVRQGHRAVIFFCVQRADAVELRPADRIDPVYGRTLRQVMAAGVEALAYKARVDLDGVALQAPLPVVCSDWAADGMGGSESSPYLSHGGCGQRRPGVSRRKALDGGE